MKNQKYSSASRLLFGADKSSRAASRTVILGAALLVALILLNLLLGLLPGKLTAIDMSPLGTYSISETSSEFAKTVKEDVTIYVVSSTGVATETLRTLLERYTSENSHIKIRELDFERDAETLARFESADQLSDMSLIVESARRYELIDASYMYYYYIESLGSFTPYEYYQFYNSDQYVSIAYQLYTEYEVNINDITHYYYCAEQVISRAIDYVTAPSIPHAYFVTGHGAENFETYAVNFLSEISQTYEMLDLSATGSVPSDCATLILYAPTSDLSAAEADAILAYWNTGGHILLVTDTASAGFSELSRVVAAMGLAPHDNIIHEGNANCYKDSDENLIPQINSAHTITQSGVSAGYAPIYPNAHGILQTETVENVTVTALFASSDTAYVVNEDGTTSDTGVMILAAAAEHATSGGKLVWFTSVDAFKDETVETDGGNALYYFAMSLYWMSRSFVSELSIAPIEILQSVLSVPAFASLLLGVVLVVLVPLVCLVIGISIRVRRKRK